MDQKRKAQSAMEYLMTYGWAILIIAVVLIALFSLGVFKPNPGNSCLGQAGFICQNAVYGANGNVIATMGQVSGTNWASANVEFFTQTYIASLSAGSVPTFSSPNTISGGLASGQTATITLPATGSITPGTTLTGSIWAQYTIIGSSSVYYIQMASVNLGGQ